MFLMNQVPSPEASWSLNEWLALIHRPLFEKNGSLKKLAWNRNLYQLTTMETKIGWKRFQGAGLWSSRGNFHLISGKDGAWEMPARVTLSSLVGMEGSQVSRWCASQWGHQTVGDKWQDMMQLRASWVHCGHCLVSWAGKKKKDKRHQHYMFHFLAVVL